MKKVIFVAATAIFVLAGCSAAAAAPATATTAKDLPVINSFTADPANIAQSGGGTQVSWRVTNATNVVIDNGIGTVALSGAFTVYPRGNTSYKITATNAAGSNGSMVKITVGSQGPPVATANNGPNIPYAPAPSSLSLLNKPVVSEFYARPSIILSGDRATLSWTVANADTVAINQGIGYVSVSGTRNVKPTETTIYTLTAYNKAGSATATAGVLIEGTLPAVPVIRWFTCNPSTILLGRSLTLGWEVSDATFVRISGIGNVEPSGKLQVYPGSTVLAGSTTNTGTVIYTLVATNAGGSSSASCQATVVEEP